MVHGRCLFVVGRLVREWTEVAQRGVPSPAIIEAFDVKENVGLCLLTHLVSDMMHPLHFWLTVGMDAVGEFFSVRF